MSDTTRPLFALYVVWHPDFPEGGEIAENLREHYRRKIYENVAGGTGLSVLFRSIPVPGSSTPLSIDIDDAETTAVVVLADPILTTDADWIHYVQEIAQRTEAAGLGTRVFPVAIHRSVLTRLNIDEQALRWDRWTGTSNKRQQRLIFELTHQFCRMLRHYLARLKHPTDEDEALGEYLHKVQIFLSHSKHDDDGERIANKIRNRIHSGRGLSTFFDVYDIPAGLRFHKVLLRQIRVSAVVVIHTNSYSSREWCRREVLEAKLSNVPLVVANSISDVDERGFPYMGNVPVVRLLPSGVDRIDVVIGRLLDEVLKDFLWRCRVEIAGSATNPALIFLPRPPELISLAGLPPVTDIPEPLIVYPDPPISAEEERLFERIAPNVQLRSLTEWLAGAVR